METAIKTTDPDRWARYLLRRGIMGEMDQKSTSEIMGKSDDTSEKGSDWRGYMDEERNRIGGATGMGRPFTASCEGAMGINDTIALEKDAACSTTVPSIDPGSEAMQALLQQAHWHEENKEDHVRTRDAVEKAAKDVIDAQVATHATVEDIARFLGVGMDGMDENHRKTHAKRDAIGGGKVSS